MLRAGMILAIGYIYNAPATLSGLIDVDMGVPWASRHIWARNHGTAAAGRRFEFRWRPE